MSTAENKFVSVVMSAYNASAYLREAIDSILGQTYSHFEFIIINDGSSDETESIIHSYTDKRIVYTKNETNLGLIASLNKGLKLAKGEFIARMDADDIALENRLSEQVRVFGNYPKAVIIGSDYYSLSKNKLSTHTNKDDSDYLKAVLMFSTCFCHPTVMMRNIFKKVDIEYRKEYVHAEDYKMWTDLVKQGEFHNVNQPLLKYRSHDSQIGAKYHEAQLLISARIRNEYLNELGFKLSNEEIRVLNIIGNNVFITSGVLLKRIEVVLLKLKSENERVNVFNVNSFNIFLNKFWTDSCGYTNLGLTAYKVYSKSQLSKLNRVSRNDKTKLLAKCMLRKFKG